MYFIENEKKNNAFAVNLLSTVDRRHDIIRLPSEASVDHDHEAMLHDIINIDLIRKPNNHYCKMSGNGSHHLYMEGTGWLYPNGGKSTIFPPKLLRLYCRFDSYRRRSFLAVMIEKVIAAFLYLGWKFSPGIEKTEGFHPPKIRFFHPFENYDFPPGCVA